MMNAISDNPDCPVCRGAVSALCPACAGDWNARQVKDYCKARGLPAPALVKRSGRLVAIRPAPLPFPVPQGSPDECQDAFLALAGDLDDMRATLDGLSRRVAAMALTRPTPAALRAAADDAFNLSDVASEAARAIHDAFPDQVAQ